MSEEARDPTVMSVTNIGVEEFREYVFTDGFSYRINKPLTLYVKRKPEGDSHRVVDAAGITHYIPAGWRILRWVGEVVS